MLGGSKKDSKLRRAEVLGSGDSSLAHHLCQHCAQNAADMLRDPLACDTVVELAQAGADGVHLCHHHPYLPCLPLRANLMNGVCIASCKQPHRRMFASTVLPVGRAYTVRLSAMHMPCEANRRCTATVQHDELPEQSY